MKTAIKQKGRPVEILLVEDNPGDAAFIRQALEQSERSIILKVSPDGESALNYLRREDFHTHVPCPDFILLDLGLPRISGWAVLSQIKQDPFLTKIPVLILTGGRNSADERRAAFSMADDYILKPPDLTQMDTLFRYLEENWIKRS